MAGKRGDPLFTPRELDVMAVLWELKDGTVGEIHARISPALAYTTVQTMLTRLEHKGAVRHTEEGKAYRYHPVIGRQVAGRHALQRIATKIFGGSREALLVEFMNDRDVSAEELEALRALIEERLRT